MFRMCDDNGTLNSDESSVKCQSSASSPMPLSLLDLPTEILLHICSFLDASTLVHSLSLVCKRFYEILNEDSLWRIRINHVWRNANFPVLSPDEDDKLFWKLSCVSIERQFSIWRQSQSLEKFSLNNVHYSSIDGLLLMHEGKICISGGRDRSLVCWSLPNEENERERAMSIDLAHEGWIWDLTAIENTVYSCSWDRCIKSWNLTSTGLVHLKTYEMFAPGALLCLTSCPESGIFAAGSFCKTVLVFDPRAGCMPIMKYQPHQRAIIRLIMNSDYILSASEDRTVSIYDRRASKTMKNITISDKSFPMCLSMHKNTVYVGDSNARLYILDSKQDFEPVKSYKTEHEKGIIRVYYGPGCLITSSLDKTVKILSPTDPPQTLATLPCGYGDIASMDYLNEVLAVSGSDAIEIWRPKRV